MSGDPPPSPAVEVFISYASHDAAVANAVVEILERHGITCWIAPRDVVPGSLYADEIVGAINDAKVVVLVLSQHSVASPLGCPTLLGIRASINHFWQVLVEMKKWREWVDLAGVGPS